MQKYFQTNAYSFYFLWKKIDYFLNGKRLKGFLIRRAIFRKRRTEEFRYDVSQNTFLLPRHEFRAEFHQKPLHTTYYFHFVYLLWNLKFKPKIDPKLQFCLFTYLLIYYWMDHAVINTYLTLCFKITIYLLKIVRHKHNFLATKIMMNHNSN